MSTPPDGPPGSTDVVLPLPMSEQDPPAPPQDPGDDLPA